MVFYKKNRLYCPGPTHIPLESALAGVVSGERYHRSADFAGDFLECRNMLAPLFGSYREPPLILTASGTAAMEALLRHLTNPGDCVAVVEGGKFGQRWSQIAHAYKLSVHAIKVTWGHSITPNELINELKKSSTPPKALFLQASETSTGVYNDIEALSQAVRDVYGSSMYIAVDAISSIGAHQMLFDEWQLDGVISGSQKGFGVPAGLSFITLSDRAASKAQTHPGFYTNLSRELRSQARGHSSWTPAVTLIATLKISLQKIHEAGLDTMLADHALASRATQKALTAMGLRPFAQSPSRGLTSIWVPEGLDGITLLKHIREHYGATLAGGQEHLKGKILRLAHLGFWDRLDLIGGVAALEMSLCDLGHTPAAGSGVKVMTDELRVGASSY